jgi:hypothetical protein
MASSYTQAYQACFPFYYGVTESNKSNILLKFSEV